MHHLLAQFQGRGSGKVREFALYGETTGETDEFALPIWYNWAAEYRGSARMVYGHTPVPEPEWLNRTVNVDTGCVFGGKLTAFKLAPLHLLATEGRVHTDQNHVWHMETLAKACQEDADLLLATSGS